MEIPRSPDLHPAFLPPETVVGPWRVVGWRGRGTYGVVYRAEGDGQEPAGLVALKIALYEGDPRFEREVELLSRVRHPSVPRLRGHGEWRSPQGILYPYLAMEWVEGLPLYEWAAARNPSSLQVLGLLAQVARALEATEAAGGVHRDVKGANVLVREEGRAVLMDFGAGHYQGAETLTYHSLPPGSPAYRSPEAWKFDLENGHLPRAHYRPGPADDLFALGVTAYRLVTGEYPPSTEPGDSEAAIWHMEGAGPRPPMALNSRVDAQLSALILRMLSVDPRARGTATGMAEALEQAARSAGLRANQPLFGWEKLERGDEPEGASPKVQEPRRARAPAERIRARAPPSRWGRRLAVAALFLVLVMGVWWSIPEPEPGEPEPLPQVARAETWDAGTADAGTIGLSDTVLEAPVMLSAPESHRSLFGLEVPKDPLKGQRRRPCGRGQVELHGGCWLKHKETPPDCPEDTYEWRGACYSPVLSSPRPATSDP